MKKQDLLDLINSLPDDADIRMERPSHDYWRTVLAIEVTGVEEVKVKPSAYHDGADAIRDDEEWDESLHTVYVLQ